MNDNTLVAVSGYAGDRHQIETNMPIYARHECPVLILSPEDAPIMGIPGATCIAAGEKGWIGPQTLVRHKKFLEILLAQPQEYFLFNDADSICLSPKIPKYVYQHDVAWSNEVMDTNPAPSFLPKIACQPPYFFSRRVLGGLLNAVNNLPTSFYGEPVSPNGWPLPFPTECIDHYHLQLSCGSGFPHRNYRDGASFETANPDSLNSMCHQVRYEGKVFIHQVKTQHVLNSLLDAYQKRK